MSTTHAFHPLSMPVRRWPDLPDLLAAWYRRSAQRRTLARLDTRLLRDVGLSREQALAEAAKPFWQV